MHHTPPGTSGKVARKRVPGKCIKKVFEAFATQYPRLAIYEGEILQLRQFPQSEEGQDHVHSQCMESARLSLQEVSKARVRWMSCAPVKREREGQGGAALEDEAAHPAQRQRRPVGPAAAP